MLFLLDAMVRRSSVETWKWLSDFCFCSVILTLTHTNTHSATDSGGIEQIKTSNQQRETTQQKKNEINDYVVNLWMQTKWLRWNPWLLFMFFFFCQIRSSSFASAVNLHTDAKIYSAHNLRFPICYIVSQLTSGGVYGMFVCLLLVVVVVLLVYCLFLQVKGGPES